MLTVVEESPDTIDTSDRWAGFPRYGIANAPQLTLMAPVVPGRATLLTLATLDGSAIGTATCAASVLPGIDLAALPRLPEGIARHLAGGKP
jgi:hypothetical protein